jgi:hypothetical protein
MLGAKTGTGTDEAVTGATEGDSMERRASHVPNNKATRIRGVTDRSGIEPVVETFSGCLVHLASIVQPKKPDVSRTPAVYSALRTNSTKSKDRHSKSRTRR